RRDIGATASVVRVDYNFEMEGLPAVVRQVKSRKVQGLHNAAQTVIDGQPSSGDLQQVERIGFDKQPICDAEAAEADQRCVKQHVVAHQLGPKSSDHCVREHGI